MGIGREHGEPPCLSPLPGRQSWCEWDPGANAHWRAWLRFRPPRPRALMGEEWPQPHEGTQRPEGSPDLQNVQLYPGIWQQVPHHRPGLARVSQQWRTQGQRQQREGVCPHCPPKSPGVSFQSRQLTGLPPILTADKAAPTHTGASEGALTPRSPWLFPKDKEHPFLVPGGWSCSFPQGSQIKTWGLPSKGTEQRLALPLTGGRWVGSVSPETLH